MLRDPSGPVLPHYLTFAGLLQCPQVQTKGTLYHATGIKSSLKKHYISEVITIWLEVLWLGE
jgi:hypothetical protein